MKREKKIFKASNWKWSAQQFDGDEDDDDDDDDDFVVVAPGIGEDIRSEINTTEIELST